MRNLLLAVLVSLGALAVVVSPALAATDELASSELRPGWVVTAHTDPTYLAPNGKGAIEVSVINDGAADSTGPVTVTDTLPPGVTAIEAGSFNGLIGGLAASSFEGVTFAHGQWDCVGNGPEGHVDGATIVTCSNDPSHLPHIVAGGGVPTRGGGEPGNGWDAQLAIEVTAPNVSGSIAQPNVVTVSDTKPPFGFADTDVWFSNANGTPDTQAGSHPYEASFAFTVNNTGAGRTSSGQMRNLSVNLPPGFVGNPTAVPECTLPDLTSEHCPPDTQVGVVASAILGDNLFGGHEGYAPVYNMVPPPGKPAEFAFTLDGNNNFVVAEVRSGSDYGLTTTVDDVTKTEVMSAVFTLWGDPSEGSHNPWRVEVTPDNETIEGIAVPYSGAPLLTLPTGCSTTLPVTFSANSWENPKAPNITSTALVHGSLHEPAGVSGCGSLGFSPGIVTSPSVSSTDTPMGLTAEVKPSVGGLESMEGLSTADLRETSVTLPEGVVINPGQAAGLVACTAAESRVGDDRGDAPECPLASKIGVVEIETPLLHAPFKGNVYIMQSNPPHLEMLMAASGEGVNLKLIGEVNLNEATGRLVTTFRNTPELPFTDFKLSFSGGAQAALDSPTHCGLYSTEANFTSWASPFIENVLTDGDLALREGPNSSGCPGSTLPFSPELSAGATTDKAGGFTGFTMLLSRGDGQQRIEKLAFRMPAGLAGMISSVPVCGEPQAAQGTCPASSKIGHTVVTSGPGPYPLVIPQPGDPEAGIYLTGPYDGAPFGLSIVTPVIAGPFNLGTVVTRARIEVDPNTAQITVATDPLPQIVAGVPTDLRSVYAVIDREGFMFNPTNCQSQTISGTAWSTAAPGQSEPAETAGLSSHFGIGSCKELGFTPKVAVSTGAHASKADGANLSFKISYPKGAVGTQSWFKEAKFDIPKQLPAELRTIQQACPSATFEANPANCSPHAKIGEAVVHTPVLPVPLRGPIYFVSYGSAKFPDAIVLLSGDNVNVRLTGETFINGKTNVTSATFPNTPDVPFESIEVTLPTGPYSEFGANLPKHSYDFCGQKLKMPTLFKAQNGLEIHQETPVTITGCPTTKKLSKKHKTSKKHKAKK